jgi:hypothetical protein
METMQEQNRRKHPRFSDRALARTTVSLDPCPPLFGETVCGQLVDLSVGGMALLSSDLIPKKVFLKMKMKLPDGFEVSSVIAVRHITRKRHQRDFLHGIEFLNPSPEMVERIQQLADGLSTPVEAPLAISDIPRPSAAEIEDFFREAA